MSGSALVHASFFLCSAPETLNAFFVLRAAYALGFLDCNDISARCMLTIFQFFATKTGASWGGEEEGGREGGARGALLEWTGGLAGCHGKAGRRL